MLKLFFRAKTRDLWLLTVGLTKQSAECRSCILFSITDFGLYAYGLQEILRDVSLYLNCVSAWCFLKIMYFYFLVSKRIHIVVLGQVQCRRQILQFFATMYIWTGAWHKRCWSHKQAASRRFCSLKSSGFKDWYVDQHVRLAFLHCRLRLLCMQLFDYCLPLRLKSPFKCSWVVPAQN